MSENSNSNNNNPGSSRSSSSFWNLFRRNSRRRDGQQEQRGPGQPGENPDVNMDSSSSAGGETASTGQRRPRPADDEDGGERDHRHPSARSTPIPDRSPSRSSGLPSSSSTSQGAHTHSLPPTTDPSLMDFATRPTLLGGLLSGTPVHIPRRPRPRQQPSQTQQQPPHTHQPTPLTSGYVRAQDVPNLLNMVRQMVSTATMNLNLDSRDNVEDPERAKKLVNALEDVPVGLLQRLEHATGDDGSEGNCAICWERLLDSDGWKATEEDSPTSSAPQETPTDPSSSSSAPPTKEDPAMKPRIVVMPCAHIFHSACLLPWFTRPGHTTCPSCRFDLDPDSLTYNAATLRHMPPPPPQDSADDAVPPTEEPQEPPAPAPIAQPTPIPSSMEDTAWRDSLREAMLNAARRRPAPTPGQGATDTTTNPISPSPATNNPLPSFADFMSGTFDPFPILRGAQQAPVPIPPRPASAPATPAARHSPPAVDHAHAPPSPPTLVHTTGPFLPNPNPMGGLGEHPRGTTMHIESDGRGNTVMTFGFDVIVDDNFMPPPGPIGGIGGGGDMPFNMHIGAGATMQEAMGSLLAGLRGRAGPGDTPAEQAGNEGTTPQHTAAPDANTTAPPPPPGGPPLHTPGLNASGLFNRVIENAILNALRNPGGVARGPDIATPAPAAPVSRAPWVLPSPPGLSLRQRVEKFEREKGWRCYDPSCGLGPTDEDPSNTTTSSETGQHGLLSKSGEEEARRVCEHTFHPACLVSAERVRCVLHNEQVPEAKGEAGVPACCLVCRHAGVVPSEVWRDGVNALA